MRWGDASASRSALHRTAHCPEAKDMTPSASQTTKPLPKARPIPGFTIDRETLSHLPDLHRAAAEIAIADGRWRLI